MQLIVATICGHDRYSGCLAWLDPEYPIFEWSDLATEFIENNAVSVNLISDLFDQLFVAGSIQHLSPLLSMLG